jgi:acyl carrier protein
MTEQLQEQRKEIEKKLIAITNALLVELGRERASRQLTIDASFERQLGIDSLGRVELFHRIEESFGIQLPQSLMAQAESLQDMIEAISNAKPSKEIRKESKVLEIEQTKYSPALAQSLVEILINIANTEPDRPHIYLQDDMGEEKVITYGDLYNKAMIVAAGLQDYDIEQGDSVAIMLPTCEEFFYTFFGILLIGAIAVPIYPPFRPDKIEEYALREASILKNANARILITFEQAHRLSELLKVFISSLKAVITFDDLKKTDNKGKVASIQTQMPALIQYTSGSTSLPKGVLLTHQNLLANIRAASEAIEIKPSDVGVSWLPLYHDMGLIGSWLICFYNAIPVVIMSPLAFLSRPEKWLWAIHYHRGTLTAAPNFAYELCIRRIAPQMIEGLDLSSWRLSFNGAEAVNPRTIENFTQKFSPYGYKPQTMFPVYGLAESSVALVFPPINREPKIDSIQRDIFHKEQRAVPYSNAGNNRLQFVSCGKAIPNHEIRVVDAFDKEVQPRVIGHIHFRGPSTMVGYFAQPEATKAITHDGWIDSGDLGYIADGELYVTGRQKDIIIKAGRNLYPEEIEEVTSQVTGVRKGCVVAFGIEDSKSGTEKLIIVVETNEKNKEKTKKILNEINEKISIVLGFVADEVILVPAKTVPKTSSGKLQRSACKQSYLDKKLFKTSLPVWVQVTKIFLKSFTTRIKQIVKLALRLTYSLYIAVLFFVFGSLVWVSAVILPTVLLAKITKSLLRAGLFIMGCPLHVVRQENISINLPCVYVANHASYLDAVVMLAVLPEGVQFVAKKELKGVPFLRTILKKLKISTVDRMDFLANIADLKLIQDKLQQGHRLVIFPEGTFTYAAGLRPFKLGAFKVAVESGVPVCPVAIAGTRAILRDDDFIFSPGKIKVTIGKLIAPESKEWQEVLRLHTKARNEIAQHCGEQVIDY